MRFIFCVMVMLVSLSLFAQKDEVNKGNSFVWQKKYAEAITHYTDAINIEKNNGKTTVYSYKAYVQRGDCYCKLNDSLNAFADLASAVALDSANFEAYGVKARCLLQLGMDSLALEAYNQVVEILKTSGIKQSNLYVQMGYYNERADLHMKLQMFGLAVEDYDHVIRLFEMSSDEMAPSMGYNPALANAYYQRGFAKLNLGRQDEACDDWKTLLKKLPKGVKAAERTENAIKANCK